MMMIQVPYPLSQVPPQGSQGCTAGAQLERQTAAPTLSFLMALMTSSSLTASLRLPRLRMTAAFSWPSSTMPPEQHRKQNG